MTDDRTLYYRNRRAAMSHACPSHKGICENCGAPCQVPQKDRFGYRLPTGCSTHCVEILLHRERQRSLDGKIERK